MGSDKPVLSLHLQEQCRHGGKVQLHSRPESFDPTKEYLSSTRFLSSHYPSAQYLNAYSQGSIRINLSARREKRRLGVKHNMGAVFALRETNERRVGEKAQFSLCFILTLCRCFCDDFQSWTISPGFPTHILPAVPLLNVHVMIWPFQRKYRCFSSICVCQPRNLILP